MFINESPIQCQIEYRAGSEQRTNSVGGMVHYIKTQDCADTIDIEIDCRIVRSVCKTQAAINRLPDIAQ